MTSSINVIENQRKNMKDHRNPEEDVEDAGVLTPRRNRRTLDTNINTIIREIDAKEYEEKVAKCVVKINGISLI